MAIITDTSPLSLSSHVPIAPPAPQQQYVVSDHDENDIIQSSFSDSHTGSSIIVSPSRHEPIVIVAENDKENSTLRRPRPDDDDDDDILHTPKKRRKTSSSSSLPSTVTPSSSTTTTLSCGNHRGRYLPSSLSTELKKVFQSLLQQKQQHDSSSNTTNTPPSKNKNQQQHLLTTSTDNKSATRKKTAEMKRFQEDYLSVLKYEKSDEHKKHDKKLRFGCFTQVKEIPSFRDYPIDERNSMYSTTREIRDNARRNTNEMWHDIYANTNNEDSDSDDDDSFNGLFGEDGDVGHTTTSSSVVKSRGQLILERALEEDEFHVYHLEGGDSDSDNNNSNNKGGEERIVLIHPATYPQWLRDQQARDEVLMSEFYRSNETSADKLFKQFYYGCGDDDDDDDDTPLALEDYDNNTDTTNSSAATDATVAAAVATAVKTYEDEHSTVFRFGFGGDDTSAADDDSTDDVLEFDADFGMDDFLVTSSWKDCDDYDNEYI